MKYEGSFMSEADGLEISVLAVLPDRKPYKGVVQLVHGMSEYKERYLPFMEYLAEQGYASAIHDHRGHGKSIRSKGDLGYMYGGGSEALLRDIGTVNRRLRSEFSELPLILFGHSMGSLAVRAFAAEHDGCMDALIVCGSPSYNAARPVGAALARMEMALLGEKHRSRLIEMISFGRNIMKFRKDKSCTSWICSDPEAAAEYEKSELCGFTFTDEAYLVLFDLMKRAYNVKKWSCTNPQLPVLFASGAEDPCLIDVRHFAKAVRSMRRAGYRDVKGKLYKEMRHEILNEKGKEQVYRDLVTWIKKKTV